MFYMRFFQTKTPIRSWVWHIFIIPALGSLKQEDYSKLETSPGCIARPYLENKNETLILQSKSIFCITSAPPLCLLLCFCHPFLPLYPSSRLLSLENTGQTHQGRTFYPFGQWVTITTKTEQTKPRHTEQGQRGQAKWEEAEARWSCIEEIGLCVCHTGSLEYQSLKAQGLVRCFRVVKVTVS